MRRLPAATLLAATLLVACRPPGATAPGASPQPSEKPRASIAPGLPQLASMIGKTRLSGRVTLITDRGGALVGGSPLITDNGLGVISNDGGRVIARDGASVIARDGASYRVMQAATTYALADAIVEVVDATGKPITGADGKPIAAKTDRNGIYNFAQAMPAAKTYVLRLKLWSGGQMSALLPRAGDGQREQAIDTATSLGAAYVLDEFVAKRPDPQATLDKLPIAEAGRLNAALAGLVAAAPKYDPAELVRLTGELRGQNRAVDESLQAIRAILLGQDNLGAGRAATNVPLADVRATAPDGQGGFFALEGVPGRVRRVGADGSLTTHVDQLHGEVKANLFSAVDLARGTDGSLYAAALLDGSVTRVAPDGTVKRIAGTGKPGRGGIGGKADETPLRPLAVTCDGDAVWIGEDLDFGGAPSRVLTIAPDGTLQEPAPAPAAWAGWRVVGLAKAKDGAWFALLAADAQKGQIWRLAPGGGAWEQKLWDVETALRSDLSAADDGGLWLSEDLAGRVVHMAPDGTRRVVSDRTAGSPILRPGDVDGLPGGGVRVADERSARVYEIDAAGEVTAVAGATTVPSTGDAIALNGPLGAAIDQAGQLHIVEVGAYTVKRWTGSELVTVAGSGERGFAGDGGPATAADMLDPANLLFRGPELIVLDRGNGRIRSVTDGTITTLAGRFGGIPRLRPGDGNGAARAADLDFQNASGMAVGKDGTLYVTMLGNNQIVAIARDGSVKPIASGDEGGDGDGGPLLQAKLNTPVGLVAGPDGALYVVDTGNMRIRKIPDPAAASPTIEAFAGAADGLGRMGEAPPASVPRADAVFSFPAGACFDQAGNMYVAEFGTLALPLLARYGAGLRSLPLELLPKVAPRIRKIAADGTVTVVAGPGGKFFADMAAADALLLPMGVAIDAQGRLVIADPGANLVRILPAGTY